MQCARTEDDVAECLDHARLVAQLLLDLHPLRLLLSGARDRKMVAAGKAAAVGELIDLFAETVESESRQQSAAQADVSALTLMAPSVPEISSQLRPKVSKPQSKLQMQSSYPIVAVSAYTTPTSYQQSTQSQSVAGCACCSLTLPLPCAAAQSGFW